MERPERRFARPDGHGFDQADIAHHATAVRDSCQVRSVVAPKITTAPASAHALGVSSCTSQDQIGLSAGSTRRTIAASNAVTFRTPVASRLYATPICTTPR